MSARAEAYRRAIDLAGRGVLWPIVIGVSLLVGITAYLTRQSLTAAFVGKSLWIYLAMTLLAAGKAFAADLEGQWATILAWFVLFAPTGIVTMIWASQGGLSGGLSELAAWIDLVGIALALVLAVIAGLGRYDDPFADIAAGIAGYAVGAVAFTVSHVLNEPPTPGSWWVAPVAAGGAILARALWGAVTS